MSALNFFHPVLKALEEGKVIRKTVALALQASGVLALLAGLYLLVQVLKFSFSLPSAEATIGGVLFGAFLAVTVVCISQIYFYRAASVNALGASTFTVIPIFSILLRTIGETYATAGAALGVGGCLFIWLAQINPLQMLGSAAELLPSMNTESSFMGGLMFLVYLVLVSLGVLIVFYFLAEAVVVVADIARNVRILVQSGGGAPAHSPSAAPSQPACPACGNQMEADSDFCGACGARVRSHSLA